MGRRILLALLAFFTSVATASAQASGRIAGKVSTVDGQPIAGVQIVVAATGRGALSDTGGRFLVTGVPAGTHAVTARSLGWSQATSSVTVVAGQTANVA